MKENVRASLAELESKLEARQTKVEERQATDVDAAGEGSPRSPKAGTMSKNDSASFYDPVSPAMAMKKG